MKFVYIYDRNNLLRSMFEEVMISVNWPSVTARKKYGSKIKENI